jgi:putative DNA primase/helicase
MTITLVEKHAPYTTADLFKKFGINFSTVNTHNVKGAENLTKNIIEMNNSNSGQISDGRRNSTLTSLAGSMRRRGMSHDAIAAALQQENLIRCAPPLEEDEVDQIAGSISRYDPDEVASRPVLSRTDISKLIEAATDFDELTGNIAVQVTHSQLRESEKEVLRKAIAKKTGVSIATIKNDAKNHSHSGKKFDHLATALAVKALYGKGNIIYAQSSIWSWQGNGIWEQEDERKVKQKVHEVASDQGLTANVINSIVDMVKTESHLAGFMFNTDTSTINCMNGELKLVEGKWQLVSHERDHHHTAMLPVSFNAAATAPRFTLFLDEVFNGDPDANDKIDVVLEALGYTLITGCHLERFFMLIGSGANGKSVLLLIVAELIGRKYVCAVQPSQFENRFQRGHLQGKLANIITEIAEGAEIADAQLKSLVSGEMTTAEHKHKDPFDFIPYAKHWFGTNHLPHTRDFSDALFRRAIILTFNNKFEGANCDVHLAEKLKVELPGILNMALAGLQRLIERKEFTKCISSSEIARKWRMEADQVAQFVEDDCDKGTGLRCISGLLYLRYKDWADRAGIKRTLNRNNFTTRLERLGFTTGRGTGGTRMIDGIDNKPAVR